MKSRALVIEKYYLNSWVMFVPIGATLSPQSSHLCKIARVCLIAAHNAFQHTKAYA